MMQFFEEKLPNLQAQMNVIDLMKIKEDGGINQITRILILMINGNE